MRIFRGAIVLALLLALPAIAMRGDASGLLSGDLLAAWNANFNEPPVDELPKIEVLRPEQVAVMPEIVAPRDVVKSAPMENNADEVEPTAGRILRPAIYRPMASTEAEVIRRIPRGTDL